MSEPVFVDTNVFLRFFVRDVEPFYQKAKGLFEKAEKGEIRLENMIHMFGINSMPDIADENGKNRIITES